MSRLSYKKVEHTHWHAFKTIWIEEDKYILKGDKDQMIVHWGAEAIAIHDRDSEYVSMYNDVFTELSSFEINPEDNEGTSVLELYKAHFHEMRVEIIYCHLPWESCKRTYKVVGGLCDDEHEEVSKYCDRDTGYFLPEFLRGDKLSFHSFVTIRASFMNAAPVIMKYEIEGGTVRRLGFFYGSLGYHASSAFRVNFEKLAKDPGDYAVIRTTQRRWHRLINNAKEELSYLAHASFFVEEEHDITFDVTNYNGRVQQWHDWNDWLVYSCTQTLTDLLVHHGKDEDEFSIAHTGYTGEMIIHIYIVRGPKKRRCVAEGAILPHMVLASRCS